MQGHDSDRPIETPDQDLLHRKAFVEKLADALVTRNRRASSGVVVGLVGPWGSGKTSLANLLDIELRTRFGERDIILLRFAPWLISGRDDLILRFFTDLQAQLQRFNQAQQRHSKRKQNLQRAIRAIKKYNDQLGAGATALGAVLGTMLALPGLSAVGGAVSQLFRSLRAKPKDNEGTIEEAQTALRNALGSLEVPIIVVIDEVDRLEDNEIRSIAQLVRVVADFPAVSYLLLYDHPRVVEALGHGDVGRGSAYLEKIVQLEIRLPVLTTIELREFARGSIGAAAQDLELPGDWQEKPRLDRLIRLAIPSLVNTMRDAKRWIAAFRVNQAMVLHESDWIDVLAFTLLELKFDQIVRRIHERPFVAAPDAPDIYVPAREHWQVALGTPEELRASLLTDEDSPAARKLLEFLFPHMADDARDNEPVHPARLSHWGALMTILKKGLQPGAVSRADISQFVTGTSERRMIMLHEHHQMDTIYECITKITGLALDVKHDGHRNWIEDIFLFADQTIRARLDDEFKLLHIDGKFWHMFSSLCERDHGFREQFADVLREQCDVPSINLAACVLRNQIGRHGRQPGISAEQAVLGFESALALRRLLATSLCAELLDNRMFPGLRSGEPLWLIVEAESWSQDCRCWLTEALGRSEVLDELVAVHFAPGYRADIAGLGTLVDVNRLQERVAERVNAENLQAAPPVIQTSYRRFQHPRE